LLPGAAIPTLPNLKEIITHAGKAAAAVSAAELHEARDAIEGAHYDRAGLEAAIGAAPIVIVVVAATAIAGAAEIEPPFTIATADTADSVVETPVMIEVMFPSLPKIEARRVHPRSAAVGGVQP
jgi:hypothetical protein